MSARLEKATGVRQRKSNREKSANFKSVPQYKIGHNKIPHRSRLAPLGPQYRQANSDGPGIVGGAGAVFRQCPNF